MSLHRSNRRKPVSKIALALVIGSAGLGISACGVINAAENSHRTAPTDVVCATEDSLACLWNAQTQGNGEGVSVYNDAQGNSYVKTLWIRGDVDGHKGCRAVVGPTSVVFCPDGYVSTS